MTIKEIMDLDCRIEGNAQILQRELKTVKKLSENLDADGMVSFWAIEKMICATADKCGLFVSSIKMCPGVTDKGTILWSARIAEAASVSKTYGPIYAVSIYEIYAKILLKERSILRGKKVSG